MQDIAPLTLFLVGATQNLPLFHGPRPTLGPDHGSNPTPQRSGRFQNPDIDKNIPIPSLSPGPLFSLNDGPNLASSNC